MFFKKAIQNFQKKFPGIPWEWRVSGIILKFLLAVYPIVFGGIIVWTSFVDATSKFLNILFDIGKEKGHHFNEFKPDRITISLWASILLWGIGDWQLKRYEKKRKRPRKRS